MLYTDRWTSTRATSRRVARRRVRVARRPLQPARPVARARAGGLLARALAAARRDRARRAWASPEDCRWRRRGRCSTSRSRSRRSAAGSHRRRWSSTRSRPRLLARHERRRPRRRRRRHAPSPPSRCGRRVDGVARLVPGRRGRRCTSSRSTARSSSLVTSPPGVAVPNLASSPLADRALGDGDRRVLATGDDARAALRSTPVASGGCSPPRRSSASGWARSTIGGALRHRAPAVRRADRLLPEPPAHARRRRGRARRRAAARPQGGVGVRRRPPTTPPSSRAMAFLFAAEQAQRAAERGAPLPRRLRVHGGVRHPALLPPGQGLGDSCSTSRRASTARLADLRYGTHVPRAADWTSRRRRRRSSSATRCARSSPPSSPTRCASSVARHRHHARLAAAPGDRPTRAGSRRRCPRRRAAAGAVPRSSRCCSASSSWPGAPYDGLSIVRDGGVGASRTWATRCSGAKCCPSSSSGEALVALGLHRTRLRLRRRRGPHARGARRRRLAHRRPEDVHQRRRGVRLGLPPHPHEPDVPKHAGPHVLPRADGHARHRAPGGPHAPGQAHEHHLLRRRARRRRVARRRGRRRLAGDAGRAVVRARARRRRARRRAPAHASPRTHAAARRPSTATRRARRPRSSRERWCGSRSTTRSPTCSPAGPRGWRPRAGSPALEGAAAQAVRDRGVHARRESAARRSPGPTGLVQSHDRAATSTASSSTATGSRPSPRSTAAPARSSATSSPNAGSASRARADGADTCAGSRTSASRRTWTRSAPRCASSSPARSPAIVGPTATPPT